MKKILSLNVIAIMALTQLSEGSNSKQNMQLVPLPPNATLAHALPNAKAMNKVPQKKIY